MADTSRVCSEEELLDYAHRIKVCGHPLRLKILCLIADGDDPCVSELWACLNQPQPVISQHLAVLKEKGIVRSEVKGNRRTYSIVDPFVRRLIESLQEERVVV
ncbi:MAG: transcriptional regulator [Spirochaetaceae bacterium]|nr:MAG: transcriptional regulator [Spirochaetaceae bacterium]